MYRLMNFEDIFEYRNIFKISIVYSQTCAQGHLRVVVSSPQRPFLICPV